MEVTPGRGWKSNSTKMDNGGNLGGSSNFLSRFAGKVQLRQDDGSISPLDSVGFAFGPSSQASVASELSAESTNPKPTNRRLRASSGATRNPAPSDGLCNINENKFEMGQTQAGATVFAPAMPGAASPSKAESTSAADLRRRLGGGGAPRPLATEAPPAANFVAAPPSAFATSAANANYHAGNNGSSIDSGGYTDSGYVGHGDGVFGGHGSSYHVPAAVPPPLSPTNEEVSQASSRSRYWDAAPSTRLNPPTHDAPTCAPPAVAPAPSAVAAPPQSDVFAAYASYQQHPAKNEAGTSAAPKGGRRAARPGVADLQRLLAQPDATPVAAAATRAEPPPSPRSIPRDNLYGGGSINSNRSGRNSAGRGQYACGSGGASTAAAAAADSRGGGSYANIHQRQRSPRAAPSQPLQPTSAAPSQGRYSKYADYEPYQDLAAPLPQDLAPQVGPQYVAQDGCSHATCGGEDGYSHNQNGGGGYGNGYAAGGGSGGEGWEDADEEYEELYGDPEQQPLSHESTPQPSNESGRGVVGPGRGGGASAATSVASGYSSIDTGRSRPCQPQQRSQQQQAERSTVPSKSSPVGAGRGAGGKGVAAASGGRRRPGAGSTSSSGPKSNGGAGVEDGSGGAGGGRVLSSGAVATLSKGPSAGQAHQPSSAANTKLVGDARNAQLVRNSTDQLHFSRKARPVNYEPCTVNQWRSEKGDSKGKLVEIKGSVHRPDPNREDLVAKRQNADRVKEFAKNLNRLNMAELKDKPTAPPVSLGQPKPPPDNARERAKKFAENLPKPAAPSTRQPRQAPTRQQQQQGAPMKNGENAEAAAEARAAAKAASQRADTLAALEQRHELQRAEADRMRRNFGL